MTYQEKQRHLLACRMQAKLMTRIILTAEQRRDDDVKWKRIVYALWYGAGLQRIMTGRF